ncbi:MAG: hypothetical protein C4344_05830, partial [Acidimicrobiia bacterium]
GSPARRLASLAVLAATVLGACAAPRYRYVHSNDRTTYLKVPRDWAVFDERQLLDLDARVAEARGRPRTEVDHQIADLIEWRVGFDADPRPSPVHLFGTGDAPAVQVTVRRLLADERDKFSLASLRNTVVPYDQLVDEYLGILQSDPERLKNPDFRPLGPPQELNLDGMRGVRLVYNLRLDRGVVYTIDQTSIVDAEVTRLHQLLIIAPADQYVAMRPTLRAIQTSFTVKKKD